MCVVIDMNVFGSVFNPDDDKHIFFEPVKSWVINGKAKIVMGGTKYYEELEKLAKYRKLILALKRAGKVYDVPDTNSIDKKSDELAQAINHRDFDDPHIVALLIISGCPVICSNDERAFPFFQKREWYPKGQSIPKVYCERSYACRDEILNDSNLMEKLKPLEKLNKKAIETLRI